MSEIVDSLRNFSRLDEAEFQRVDIHQGIESSLTLLPSQLGDDISVVRDCAEHRFIALRVNSTRS